MSRGVEIGVGVTLLLLGLALSIWLAVYGPHPLAALAVPGVVAVGMAAVFATRHPLAPLAGLLLIAAFALSRSEGVQPIEVLFAGYLYVYLIAWYTKRLLVYKERIVRDTRDAVLLLFPIYVAASVPLALLFGTNLGEAANEWIRYSLLWLYFPIREATERYKSGSLMIGGALITIASTAFVRNIIQLRRVFAEAEYVWEVARARATSNEVLIMAAALLCLTLAASSKSWKNQILGAAGFGIFSLGVILTQWRGYYIALAFGVIVLFVLLEGKGRLRLALVGLASGFGVALVAFLAFGDTVMLLALGLLDRFLSIGTAGSADVSLLNRWFEAEALWSLIQKSPLVGYGIGTSFGFFDATTHATWVKPYSHNGYMHLWFKFGIIGLLGFLYAWFRSAWDGWRASRESGRSVLGLACAVSLIAVIPSTLVAAPFTTSDVLLCFALLMGAAAGVRRVNDKVTVANHSSTD